MHKVTIFKLFRLLQLQFSAPTGIHFRYIYSFVGLTGIFLYSYSSVQLHKKWSVELFSENYSYSYIKMVFKLKCNDFKKNGTAIPLKFLCGKIPAIPGPRFWELRASQDPRKGGFSNRCMVSSETPVSGPRKQKPPKDSGHISTLACDCSDQLQGVPGPPGPKCQKSLKKVVSGLSARSAKKAPKKSKKCRKSLSSALFWHFFDFFGTFLALRADRPETTFLRLFWHFGPGGPGTPCNNWSLQSQTLALRAPQPREAYTLAENPPLSGPLSTG